MTKATPSIMDGLITPGEVCELTGITKSNLGTILQAGAIPRPVDGMYALGPTMKAYCDYLRSQRRHSSSTANEDHEADKARQAKAKADLLEMEAAVAAGGLTTIEHVEKFLSERFVRFRQRLLALPSKAAPLVVNEEIQQAHEIIKGLCNEALKELSTNGLRDGPGSVGRTMRPPVEADRAAA